MGFFSGIVGALVKTALTPIGVAKDIVNVAMDEDADATKNLVDGALDDAEEALDAITGG